MPATVTDPFGNQMEVCSISTMLKAQLPKLSWLTEAQYGRWPKPMELVRR